MVTVIIPSYNRAHLLPMIIPSYDQELVGEIILVDDASTDNTTEIVAELQTKVPNLRYHRLAVNSKQMVAKNVGIKLAQFEWVYFGDDDSLLFPNSIKVLYDTAQEYGADICGAKALYMQTGSISDIPAFVSEWDKPLPSGMKFADIITLTAHFDYSSENPVELPFVQASALVRTGLAKTVLFDSGFTGNAYREETDFFIRCHLRGAKILYQSRAVQINLPRQQAAGGAHTKGRLYWYYSAICNNWYFLNKNWKSMKESKIDLPSKFAMQLKFIKKMCVSGFVNLMS